MLMVAGMAIGQEAPKRDLGQGFGSVTIQTLGFTDSEDSGVDVISIEVDNDKLIVVIDKWAYTYGNAFTSCLVMGCTDDHKSHKRERITIDINTHKIISTEIGQLVDKTTTTTVKDWQFKQFDNQTKQ